MSVIGDQLIIVGVGLLFLGWSFSKTESRLFRLLADGAKRYQTLLFCGVLLLTVILAHEKTFFAYFQGDDFVIIEEYLSGSHPLSHLKDWFLGKGDAFYRPLVHVLFALDSMIWGTAASGYHLTNLGLHYFNSLLVFLIAGRFMQNRIGGLGIALLFAVHPVHLEAIAWISGRPDALCLFFFLLAIAFYLASQTSSNWSGKLFYGFSLLSFALALSSKEMALTLPLVIILMDVFYLTKPPGFTYFSRAGFRHAGKMHGPFLLMLGLYLVGRVFIKGGIGGYINAAGQSVHLQFSMTIFDYIIDKLNRLTIPLFSFNSAHALIFLLFLLLLTIFLKKSCQFGFAWIFITLLPVANLYQEGGREHAFLAERYLYLPSVGFCFLFAPLVEYLTEKRSRRTRVKTLAAGGLLLGVFGYDLHQTRCEAEVWRTASEIARNIPLEVKAAHPVIAQTSFYFENLPDSLAGAYIYRLGIEMALKLVYRDAIAQGDRVASYKIEDCHKINRELLGNTAFCFRYANGHVADVTKAVLFDLDLGAQRLAKQDYLIAAVLDFRKPGTTKFLYRGWSLLEEWGRWGNAQESSVIFALPAKRASVLTVKLRPVHLEGKNQVVQIYLNDTLLKQATFDNDQWTLLTVPVPETVLNGNVEMLRFVPQYILFSESIGVQYIKIE